MNAFVYNGISSADMGLFISEKNIYSAPQRDFTVVSVPGRDGDVFLDNGRYKNIDVSYTVSFTDAARRASDLRYWLQARGYGLLTDTYQPEYFRKAIFSSKLDISEVLIGVGKAKINFNCDPYLYLFSGAEETTITQSGTTLRNPEMYTAIPKIRIYGTGDLNLYVNSSSYYITDVDGDITLDCASKNAYKGAALQNDKIQFSDFPVLKRGNNAIGWSGNVTKVLITPNWRTI